MSNMGQAGNLSITMEKKKKKISIVHFHLKKLVKNFVIFNKSSKNFHKLSPNHS